MQSARLSDLIRDLKMKDAETINAQELRIRYALECFLKRLSRSEYRDNFVLKGGFLMGDDLQHRSKEHERFRYSGEKSIGRKRRNEKSIANCIDVRFK